MMGRRALEDYGRKITLVQGLTRALTCGEAFVQGRVEELLKRERESERELRRLRLLQAAADADGAVTAARAIGAVMCVRRVFDAAGAEYLKAFAERVVASPGRLVIAIDRTAGAFQWIAAHSLGEKLDLAEIVPPLLAAAGAKGGGRGARMQGVGARGDSIAAFADGIEAGLSRKLGSEAS
jgi:alanyl-tRNA synthetase